MVVVCDCGVARCVRLLSRAPALVSRPPACSPVPSEATLSPPPRGHHTPTPPEQALAARIWHIFGRAGASNAAQPPTLTTNRIPNPLAPLYDIHVVCYRRGGNQPPHTTTHPYILDRAAWLPPLRFARARSSCGGVVVTSVAAVRARWRSQDVRVGKKKGWLVDGGVRFCVWLCAI